MVNDNHDVRNFHCPVVTFTLFYLFHIPSLEESPCYNTQQTFYSELRTDSLLMLEILPTEVY